jgi:hypothetical protein
MTLPTEHVQAQETTKETRKEKKKEDRREVLDSGGIIKEVESWGWVGLDWIGLDWIGLTISDRQGEGEGEREGRGIGGRRRKDGSVRFGSVRFVFRFVFLLN